LARSSAKAKILLAVSASVRVTAFWFCSPLGFVFVATTLKSARRFSYADVADVVTLAMCGLVRIVPFDVAGCRLLAQRASQVLANVQRPSSSFASLSRREKASPIPRRPALARDRTWVFAWLRTLRSLACGRHRLGANAKLPLTLRSEFNEYCSTANAGRPRHLKSCFNVRFRG
jgi:hypothetical protein